LKVDFISGAGMNAWVRNNKGILSGLMMGSLALSGCLSNDAESGNVKIAGLKVTPAAVRAGQSVDVEGTVSSADGLTSVKITVWKGDSDVTVGKGFEVKISPLLGTVNALNLKTDAASGIAVGGAVAIGDYTVTVMAKSRSDSAVATTSLKVDGTAVVMEELTLGSNQNATGGSVDLDDLKVYTHEAAKAVSAKIDLYYAHSASGEDKLFSPLEAMIAGFGVNTNGPSTWSIANATVFRKLDLTDSAFAAIATQESIDDLWTTGDLVASGSDAVAVGSTYIVNTDMAKKVLIRVTAYAAGDTGTITVKGTR
jgi:hypothetical protein